MLPKTSPFGGLSPDEVDEIIVSRARLDPSVMAEYILTDETTGKPIISAPIHHKMHELVDKHDRLVLVTAVAIGKALALDTPVPTPRGYVKLGDIKVGDAVFASSGAVCRVIAVSSVMEDRPCYRVSFIDGEEIIADADHQWWARDLNVLRKSKDFQVVTTRQMVDTGVRTKRGQRRWSVPTPGPLQFPFQDDLPVPPLPSDSGSLLGRKSISSIEEVPSQPVRCLVVDSPDSSYLCGVKNTVTHNSNQITICRPLHLLGRDIRRRILIVSKTRTQAEKFVGAIRWIIDNNPRYRKVFPNVQRGPIWRAHAFCVDTGESKPKDFSVEAIGIFGSVMGARYTDIFIDDPMDYGNTITPYQREKVINWFEQNCFGRLEPGGRIVMLTNPWSHEDAAHVFGGRPSWHFERIGVETPDGQLTWEEKWPRARIEKFEADFGKAEADRQLRAVTPVLGGAIIREEWIERSLLNGRGKQLVHAITPADLTNGAFVRVGVDLASTDSERSHFTVLVAVLVQPATPGGNRGKRRVLCIERGKWGAPEIKAKILEWHHRFLSPVFIVDDVGAQRYIRQDLCVEHPEIQVRGFATAGTNKWHPVYGINGLGAEMEQGLWEFPCTESEQSLALPQMIQILVSHLKICNPSDHVPDVVSALWFAREGARQPNFNHSWEAVNAPASSFQDVMSLVSGPSMEHVAKAAQRSLDLMQRVHVLGDERAKTLDDFDRLVADRFGLEIP